MNPTEIKHALATLGGGANKTLGQHFLVDKNVLQKIVDAASIKDGDHVIEIGPGLGVLTEELIRRGADVTAIEQDMRTKSIELIESFADKGECEFVEAFAIPLPVAMIALSNSTCSVPPSLSSKVNELGPVNLP